MWTRFRNDGNVPTQYAANTASDRIVKDEETDGKVTCKVTCRYVKVI